MLCACVCVCACAVVRVVVCAQVCSVARASARAEARVVVSVAAVEFLHHLNRLMIDDYCAVEALFRYFCFFSISTFWLTEKQILKPTIQYILIEILVVRNLTNLNAMLLFPL